MKSDLLKFTLILSFLFILPSCKENDEDGGINDLNQLAALFQDQIATHVMAEFIDDDLEKIVLARLYSLNENHRGIVETHPVTGINPFIGRATCAGISIDIDNNQVVVDYGSGCESTDGIFRAGKITIDFENEQNEVWADITVTLDNYSVERIGVEGQRVMTNSTNTASPYIDVQSEIASGILTFEDNTIYQYSSTRTLSYIQSQSNNESFFFQVDFRKTGSDRANRQFELQTTHALTYSSDCQASNVRQPGSGRVQFNPTSGFESFQFGQSSTNVVCIKEVLLTQLNGLSFTVSLNDLIINN